MPKIIILGDLFPKGVTSFPKMPSNDFCLANLECAITENSNPIKKDGPNLRINETEAIVISTLGIDLVGLANNHILDFGSDGLKDTISYLNSIGVKHSGTSLDGNFYMSDIGGKKICFYFVSEHQYNFFGKDNIKVNLLENCATFAEISDLKSKCDYLIVCFHGGKEYYLYPTPLQQKTCRKFVDSGADFVVCQHSHCVGCKERYKNVDIVYGQGNFAFPYSNNEDFKTGIVIELDFGDDKPLLTLLPVVHKEKETIRYADDEEKRKILDKFEHCSLNLAEKSSENLYDEMVAKYGLDFLYRLFNKSKLYTRLDTSRFFKNRMLKRYIRKNKKYVLYLYNYFNCETHIEYIKAILSRQIETEVKR